MSKEREEVEIKGYGLGAKFTGPQVTCVIVLLLLGGFIGYMIYQHSADAHEGMERVVRAQQAVKEELASARETQEAMIYVLSLKQEDREKLNLAKPKKLEDMRR